MRTRGVLLRARVLVFFLLSIARCHYPPDGRTRRGSTVALAQEVRLDVNIADNDWDDEGSWNMPGTQPLRILTVLTTYNKRTPYAKANREALEEREDGYESLVSDCCED